MSEQIDALVAAAIHDAKNALMQLDTQLAEMSRRPASPEKGISSGHADFSAPRATVSRIAGQLAELLTLYRAQGGQLRLAIDDHNLSDFLDDLLAELGPLPGHLKLDVNRTAALTLGSWAFDAYLVRLVLLDALRNAARHASTHVSLALEAVAEGGMRFVVRDDGPGFPAEVIAGENAASSGSTGLGLSFARLIARQHATPAGKHGRIELANAPGAVLALYLP